jgi:adenylate cyclase
VTYGNVGVAGRLDFTVIGPAINEAARLEALSKTLKRDVLLSDAFARHVAEPLTPLGKHCLRGVSAKHEIYTPGPAPERP